MCVTLRLFCVYVIFCYLIVDLLSTALVYLYAYVIQLKHSDREAKSIKTRQAIYV